MVYVTMNDDSMVPVLHHSNLVAAHRQSFYRPGDIVVLRVPAGQPDAGQIIIHRIKSGTGVTGFVTQGDANLAPDSFHPKAADILARVWFHTTRAVALVALGTVAGVLLLLGAGIVVVARRRRREKRIIGVPPGPTAPALWTAIRPTSPDVGPMPATVPRPADGAFPPTSLPARAASGPPKAEATVGVSPSIDAQLESTARPQPINPRAPTGAGSQSLLVVAEPVSWAVATPDLHGAVKSSLSPGRTVPSDSPTEPDAPAERSATTG
jgi:hypothetical protein